LKMKKKARKFLTGMIWGKNEKYIEEDAKIYGRDSQNDSLL